MRYRAIVLLVALLLTLAPRVHAQSLPPHAMSDSLDLPKMERYAAHYAKAAAANPKDFDLRIKTAVYGFWCWRLEKTDNKRRLRFATLAFQMGKEAAELRPGRAEGHHWIGVGLGMIGLTRGVLNSLQLVPQGIRALERSAAIDPDYYNGSARAQLARMYTMLPGFPISIGDRKKALEYITPLRKKFPGAALWYLYEADLLWSFGRKDEALVLLDQFEKSKPVFDHEYFTYHTSKGKAELLRKLITSGAPRDPFFDVVSDLQPGLVD